MVPRRSPKCSAKRYGLVISDWNMEPMSGYDLLREVRADPRIGETPFIMVTAESKTENVIAAKQGRRQQLHRQAVQRANAEGQDRGRVRRARRSRASRRRPSTRLRLPVELPRDRLRRQAGGGENRVQARRGPAFRAPPNSSAWMPEIDEQAIDAEGRRAFKIGAHQIADREHPLQRWRHRRRATRRAGSSAAS